ncbi:hypothetical protein GCM10008932_07190 [Alkalibacterium iburiense]|uniref:Uncharacterized protein n=1 Tax=Alkalibacterium iburiense TaxID=290589 RepID=A0ABN0X776_9LACT
MERIKKMTKKQKTIAAVTVAGIVLTGGVIGGVSSMNRDLDNELATAQETPEKSELELTLDYKENLKEEYEVISDGEELSIKTADVTPEIDTSEIGTSNHEVEIDEMVFDLTVVVEDNRELKLNEFTELTLETEISKEDLEAQMTKGLTPELEEGDELDFLFSYPEEFNLKNEGEHEVEVTARFANNHRNSVKQTVMVTVEKPEEEVEEETNVDEVATETGNSDTESTSSSASSNNSGSTGSTNTASTGGSSNSGSTGSSSESAGSTGGSSNSGSTGSSSEASGSSDSSSTESSNSGSSGSTGGESVSSSEPQNKDNEASSEPTPSKEESKPEESTGPAPTPAPSTPAPPGVPSGATKTDEDGRGGHEYSLNRNIPGGGKITAAVVDTGVKDVLLAGTDNAGNHFIAVVSRGSYGYMGDYPTISDEAANMLRELGSQFLSAHGM